MLTRGEQPSRASVGDASSLCPEKQIAEFAGEGDTVDFKRQATATAKLALQGFALHPVVGGGFVIARWNFARHLANLNEVYAFLERLLLKVAR